MNHAQTKHKPLQHKGDIMPVYVQAKIRLKNTTSKYLKTYCEHFETTQSKAIEKALVEFFEQDKEVSKLLGLNNSVEHDVMTVAEVEDFLFERYQIIIYIHAEQKEKIGINLDPWPKCLSKYTIKEFKEKIIRRCLAKEVDVTILDHEANPCNQRTTIKGLKVNFKKENIDLTDLQSCHDIWSEYSETLE